MDVEVEPILPSEQVETCRSSTSVLTSLDDDDDDDAGHEEPLMNASDFHFSVFPGQFAGDGIGNSTSTADELFFDGKILPIPIHHGIGSRGALVPPSPLSRPKDTMEKPSVDNHHTKAPTSLWGFGFMENRSLKVEEDGHSNPSLSRSKSIGSSNPLKPPNQLQRQSSGSIEEARRRRRNSCSSINSSLRKQTNSIYNNPSGGKSSSSDDNSSWGSSSSSSYYYVSSGCRGGGGIEISPVLNFPPLRRLGNFLSCFRKERNQVKKPTYSSSQ